MQKKIQLKNGYTFNRVINGCWQLSAEHCLNFCSCIRNQIIKILFPRSSVCIFYYERFCLCIQI